MIKQNKTRLPFLLGAILFLSVAFVACNNDEKKAKDQPVTTVPAKEPIDTMEKTKGSVSPVEEVKPK